MFSSLQPIVIIFQSAIIEGGRRFWRWGAKGGSPSAYKSPRQGVGAFHYAVSTCTGLSARPIYLIISLENCTILLFFPPTRSVTPCHVCILRFRGGSVHLRGIELVTGDFKKINCSQV